jgi:hypothetical protein
VDGAAGADTDGAAVGPSAEAEAWTRKLHDLHIQNITDEYARKRAEIQSTYEVERQKARESGADTETIGRIFQWRLVALANLEQAHRRELRQSEIESVSDLASIRAELIEDEHQRQLQLIQIRYQREVDLAKLAGDKAREQQAAAVRDAETAVANQRRAGSVADIDTQNRQRFEDSWIRANLKGVQQEKALLELQKQRDLDAAKKTGANVDLIEAMYDAESQMLDAQSKLNQSKASLTRGLFNPFAAGQALGVQSGRSLEKIGADQLAEVRKGNKLLENIDRALRSSGIVVGA